MPKRSSPKDNHHTYRLELQQTERDALEMVAASQTFKNVGEGIGSIIRPFTQCSVAGSIMALTIFETILFTQDKGILKGLFGLGTDIGEYTYQAGSSFVDRMQDNFVQNKESRAEEVNPEHRTELSERAQKSEEDGRRAGQYQRDAEIRNTSWSPKRGGWVNPVTGDVVSTDPNDPLYV